MGIRTAIQPIALAAFLLSGAAAAVDGHYVRAFIAATDKASARVVRVEAGMQDYTPLADMVKDGRIASPYDCLPEHRVICFDVLKGRPIEDEAIQEWGEWRDGVAPEDMPSFVDELVTEAASRGFNLLTNEELAVGR